MSDRCLNEAFIGYLKDAIGEENARVALAGLSESASVSVRFNPYKSQIHNAPLHLTNHVEEIARERVGNIEVRDALKSMAERHFGLKTEPVPWSEYGFFLPERPVFTLDPLFHAGCYYVQDSSAMFVGHVFRKVVLDLKSDAIGRPLRVLDLCAAPGGKTTDAATSLRKILGNDFLLVSNEVMGQRAKALVDNVALWGDPCVVVTSSDPKAFAQFEDWFDIIMADVPCSGEGMFRKDEQAVLQWSESNVALCQARQRRILADVWPALAPDGMLIYSTCTFNRRENDDNALWIADECGADIVRASADFSGLIQTEAGIGLVPGLVRGEGQYCAILRKTTGKGSMLKKSGGYNSSHKWIRGNGSQALPKDIAAKVSGWVEGDVELYIKGNMITAVPEIIDMDVRSLDCLHPLTAGTAIGRLKGKDPVPDEDLALSIGFGRGMFAVQEVGREDALKFLHGDALVFPEAEKGIVLLEYEGHPLGFVKNLGSRCNNLHPASRRIRMDVSANMPEGSGCYGKGKFGSPQYNF